MFLRDVIHLVTLVLKQLHVWEILYCLIYTSFPNRNHLDKSHHN